RSLEHGARVLVAEPSAYPTQSLRTPARRAFSTRSLRALLMATGFDLLEWVSVEGTFLGCIVSAATEGPADQLEEGAAGSLSTLGGLVASEDIPHAIRVEAALALADGFLALGDGDGAGKAYFRARELDPGDPRPLAGLAQMSLVIGQPKDAESLSSMALRLDP